MNKLPSLQSDPESIPVPVEDLISQEQLLDAKFENDGFDQKGDTSQESGPIQLSLPKVSVETVPKTIHPPSNQSPLSDDVLLTPVNYPQQFCTPPPDKPDMEAEPLVEHISFINSLMDTYDNPHPTDKPIYMSLQPPKSLPTIQLPGVPVTKAEAQKLSAQAMRLLENTNIQVSWVEFCKVSTQFCQALQDAVLDTIPCRMFPSMLSETVAPSTIAMVDGHSMLVILDSG
ncbi:hypothetical protein DSO57_1024337 [Entomophthora muscae]|uniref:Uncharacterized protein n=1 Tax=Entomophthora muscae TaxID=34485 RepID=A0ACC2TE73_9FUNG|nr:hypothetical protein DSO57_1024337 [Entomophthora muscae]